jgi:hypothetical protein
MLSEIVERYLMVNNQARFTIKVTLFQDYPTNVTLIYKNEPSNNQDKNTAKHRDMRCYTS